MTFAEKLMSLRKQKGWSQEELGERLGVTRQTISKWELGSTTPEMEKIAAISELFGISADYLIKGDDAQEMVTEKPQNVGFVKGEYKSKRTWRGIPLVHVNVKGKAKGVIAVGLMAKGIISVGLLSIGVISVGVIALGIIALGGFLALGAAASAGICVGLFAAGGICAGLFAAGGIAVGWTVCGGLAAGQYAIGGCASGEIAVGGLAKGTVAIGEEVDGEIVLNLPVTAEQVRQAIMSRLPGTPQFIVDGFSALAEMLTVD